MEDREITDLIINIETAAEELKKLTAYDSKIRPYDINFNLLFKNEVVILLSSGIEEISRITGVPIIRKLNRDPSVNIKKTLTLGCVRFSETEYNDTLDEKWAKFVSENESSIIWCSNIQSGFRHCFVPWNHCFMDWVLPPTLMSGTKRKG